MILYQIKLVIKENKLDEFIEFLFSLSGEFRKEKGCLGFGLYRNVEKEDTYRVVGEWRTREAMENHFKNKHFSVLIGAARVLAESFEMSISETAKTGDFKLAGKKITLKKRRAQLSNQGIQKF